MVQAQVASQCFSRGLPTHFQSVPIPAELPSSCFYPLNHNKHAWLKKIKEKRQVESKKKIEVMARGKFTTALILTHLMCVREVKQEQETGENGPLNRPEVPVVLYTKNNLLKVQKHVSTNRVSNQGRKLHVVICPPKTRKKNFSKRLITFLMYTRSFSRSFIQQKSFVTWIDYK